MSIFAYIVIRFQFVYNLVLGQHVPEPMRKLFKLENMFPLQIIL